MTPAQQPAGRPPTRGAARAAAITAIVGAVLLCAVPFRGESIDTVFGTSANVAGLLGAVSLVLAGVALRLRRRLLLAWLPMLGLFPIVTFVIVLRRALRVADRGLGLPRVWFDNGGYLLGLVGGTLLVVAGVLAPLRRGKE